MKVKIIGQNQQNLLNIGDIIETGNPFMGSLKVAKHITEHGISLWLLPCDYEIVK